jgi:sugar/nucleoside kinase (ribokinase family)
LQTDVLFLNSDEAQYLTKIKWPQKNKVLKKLHQTTKNLVVVTEGKRGAYAFDGKFYYYIPTLQVKVVNATGAGDAFSSAFLAGLIKKNEVAYALKLGIINSTNVIQKMGAKNGILKGWPNKDELEKLRVRRIRNDNF